MTTASTPNGRKNSIDESSADSSSVPHHVRKNANADPNNQLRDVVLDDPPREPTTGCDIACCFSESASTACVG